MRKIIIYQMLPRLFGNTCTTGVPGGTLRQNGCGKFNDITRQALLSLKAFGITHIWYTGVIAHASQTDYRAYGIPASHPAVVKGVAGSPYAVRDYYDVDPDLAVRVDRRMEEFEALIRRTHQAGLHVLMDFVPNHVARQYASTCLPDGIEDLGSHDRTGMAFHPDNNFYYIPQTPFFPPVAGPAGQPPYTEQPAKATGNDCFSAHPSVNDWYETVKLNYGIDYLNGGVSYFDPIPDTWKKMRHILRYWAAKGIDGFRCDMAEMVPARFWQWVIADLKAQFPALSFIGEVYQPALYQQYIQSGFDILYDKVGLYDTLRQIMTGQAPAEDLTRTWQATEGMHGKMLSFLENHDEQRIASDFFAGSPLPGRPAMAVAALMHNNPLMIYFGQELGEQGMQEEGFSRRDGRTSIFDYAALPCIQAWNHQGRFDEEALSGDQADLRAYYHRLLVASQTKAATGTLFYDLMYAAPEGFNRQRQYAFLRYADEELLLVVANFSDQPVTVPVQIPQHAFDFLHIEPDITVKFTDLLHDHQATETLSPDFPVPVDIPAWDAVVYRCSTHYEPIDLTKKREAGTAIPLFSLRSQHDEGIGDFTDLKLLIDWAEATGQRWIQTLPVNDTTRTHTWRDSYPYSSISVFALHPLYINLHDMASGAMADDRDGQKNSGPGTPLDYDAVDSRKWRLLHAIYRQHGRKTLDTNLFKKFYHTNREWLEPYMAFCYLRDRFGTSDFRQWPEYKIYKQEEIQALLHSQASADLLFYAFVQYHADRQLKAAHAYARKKGISLKGDLPIGISRDSVDAWCHPDLFHFDMQAGAPPDDFSDDGQNWGFPTYRWSAMARDGYAWWCARLKKMAEFFDAYRIDHILGFFRIFEIPSDADSGLLGHFHPALPLSPEELQQWGISGRLDRFTQPYIDDHLLNQLFTAEDIPEIVRLFLTRRNDGCYTLKKAYTTQRAIAERFAGARTGLLKQHGNLCKQVQRLCTEVLLLPDPYAAGTYHPRIQAFKSRSYACLDATMQKRFMDLYLHFFYVRHNRMWQEEAEKKLAVLVHATHMTPCGEDLGMIPDCVPEVMHKFHILSLELERMPKTPHIEFGLLKNNPYESVCTTSSHDTSTLRGWWEEDPERSRRYYHHILKLTGEVPFFCEPWLCERIIAHHIASPSRLVILPLQDWLSVDGTLRWEKTQEERINDPADPHHYWRYRMHLTLEQLLQEQQFNEKIKRLVQLRSFSA